MAEEADINTGKPWSEMDLADLANAHARGDSVEAIATFLCRTESEVRKKIAELASSR